MKEAAREAINKVGSIISSDLVQILWILDVPDMKSRNIEKPEKTDSDIALSGYGNQNSSNINKIQQVLQLSFGRILGVIFSRRS